MKYTKYLIMLIVLLSVNSCKKFLDEPKPEDTLAPSTYYQTADQLNFALAGVYNILQSGELYKTKFHYLKGWEADEGYARASSFTGYLNSNQFTASSADIFAYWRDLYKGIARANVLLANLDNNAAIPQATRDQIRGEAFFLRGFYYFLLVQSYGGVPLTLSPVTDIEHLDLPKSTPAEIYAQIIKDMTAAEALVAKINVLGYGGRVSKSAVRGILARVCLQAAGQPVNDATKYADARKWAKMVMDDAEAAHALNPSYSDVFIKIAQDKYDIKESIWEVEFSGDGTGTFAAETGQIGYNTGAEQPQAPGGSTTLIGNGSAYMRFTANCYALYGNGDTRKGWNIQNYSLTWDGIRTYNKPFATNRGQMYSGIVAKWRREYELVRPFHANQTPQNFAILRYSDVLLMFAEAENYVNGPTAAAYDALNKVRRRAYAIGGIKSFTITNGGTGYTTAPSISIDGGGGTGGAATAVVSGGKVTAINLNLHHVTGYSYGQYTSPPTVTISGVGSGATATATLFTTADADAPAGMAKTDFQKYIQDERERELCFESLRKFDLLRWGIYVQTMQDAAKQATADGINSHFNAWYANVTDKFVLLPIPAQELLNDKALTQNPGWN